MRVVSVFLLFVDFGELLPRVANYQECLLSTEGCQYPGWSMKPRMGMESNDSRYLSSWQLTHSVTTDLYLRVIGTLLANLPQPVPRVLAQALVSGVEDVQVRCDLGGAGHGVLRSPLDAAVKTRMIVLKIALESLQTEIVNLLMSCKS